MRYEELPIEKVELDFENPRIQQFLQMYNDVTSEALSLALSGGGGKESSSKYRALRDSIKQNRGIFTPIIVNHKTDSDKYIVIEGNTRLKFYMEFQEEDPNGPWDKIMSIVYDDMSEDEIHAIRLQAHMVGARDWDPFSKAKYLDYLYNDEKRSMEYLKAFCGGQESQIRNLIDAYKDMVQSYVPMCEQMEMDVDAQVFSYYSELQKNSAKDALISHGYTLDDFTKWVITEKIDRAEHVRKLAKILGDENAKKLLIKFNSTEAIKKVEEQSFSAKKLSKTDLYDIAHELHFKVLNIPFGEARKLKHDAKYRNKLETLQDLFDALRDFLEGLDEE